MLAVLAELVLSLIGLLGWAERGVVEQDHDTLLRDNAQPRSHSASKNNGLAIIRHGVKAGGTGMV